MPFPPANHTTSSESDPRPELDQRKRKRMLSNRESARRSRMRKQQHLNELIDQVSQLKCENKKIAMQIDLIAREYLDLESGNLVLRTQLVELTDCLRSVNSVLRLVEDFSGMAMDIPEIPDPMLRPWQLPRLTRGVLASPSMIRS